LVSVVSASPLRVMETFIDAVYRYDAETVYRMLSLENQAALTMMLALARLQPVAAAERFSFQTGRQVSGQELSRWNETDFVRVVLDAPVLISQLPERSMVQCTGQEMRGDTTIVVCEVDLICGGTAEARFALVQQQGEWRIGQPFL